MRRVSLVIMGLLVYAAPLLAGNTGKIAGKVTDLNGEPLPGANVILENTTLGAATDLHGNYVILNIPPGTYRVKASMIGYRAMAVSNVQVSVDLTTKVNFQLKEEAIELGDEVVVVAERPMIVVDQTSTASVISTKQLESLPIERFEEAVTLQTGTVQDAKGGIHIRGGRANEIQYLMDGIPVTDPYSGTNGVQIENNAIQELTVVSGTFNAEYGQAQSGIINITTKSGTDRFRGNLQAFFGSYYTPDDVYLHLDQFRPLSVTDLQGSLSGPIPGTHKKMKFFLSGRRFDDDGYLWGQRWFNVSDSADFSDPQARNWRIYPTGDSAFVPLNPRLTRNLQGKLTYQLSPSLKISLSGSWDQVRWREYDHDFKYNPDGDYHFQKNANTFIFSWNHVLTSNTFYTVKLARVFSENKRFVFKNPLDPRYPPSHFFYLPPFNFAPRGAKLDHEYRSTRTLVAKGEISSQITPIHLVKAGFEAKLHQLDFLWFLIVNNDKTGFKPSIDPALQGPFGRNQYKVNPVEFAAYIQDKIELESMIVNIGLRYDMFNSDYVVPADLRDPAKSAKIPAKSKIQISPRIGVAYPISDRGVLHFSYGHFFQIPPFQFLYSNPEFEVQTGGLNSIIGNAELEPEQTIAYEFGLQQQLTEQLVIDVTGFYKDIKNLLGTEIIRTRQQTRYARYINRDYGNTRGFSISLEKRPIHDPIGVTLDYTFMIAEGNASDPDAVFLDNISVPPIESEIQQ
ncbi:MAG: TonB-dependent receptor, partial [Calditrichaeota bacterium]